MLDSKNPFDSEEKLQFWFDLNPSYLSSKKTSFKKYLQNNKTYNNSLIQ